MDYVLVLLLYSIYTESSECNEQSMLNDAFMKEPRKRHNAAKFHSRYNSTITSLVLLRSTFKEILFAIGLCYSTLGCLLNYNLLPC